MLFSFASCNQSKTSDSSASHEAGFEIVDSVNSGIDFINALEDDPLSDKNVLSYPHYFNGAGVGVGDFNNDGLQDIFFAGNEVPNAIYINKGEMKFEKLGTEAGINTNKVWASGVSIVDINADGYDDIYVYARWFCKDNAKCMERSSWTIITWIMFPPIYENQIKQWKCYRHKRC